MLTTRDYFALCITAQNDHWHIFNLLFNLVEIVYLHEALEYLEALYGLNKLQELLSTMVSADYYSYAFHHAAAEGHLYIVNRFVELAAPENLQNMLALDDYAAFRTAAENGDLDILERLSELVTLDNLQTMVAAGDYAAFRAAAENGYLDILELLVDLIDPDNLQQMISAGDYAAFRAAFDNEQWNIVDRLNELAPWMSDLLALALDPESSMQALSPDEQGCLNRFSERYQARVDADGVESIILDLRNLLDTRYACRPAQTTLTNGQTVDLPLIWSDFTALQLSESEHTSALMEYYKHKDHSAWRWLLKPNPWMAPDAEYFKINTAGTERWSEFTGYQGLIAIMYLAVTDSEMPPTELDVTIEDRLAHFIDELQLIGRAHNWDRSSRLAAECDDLAGDKPSCYSGTKKRLFHAVLWHGLLCRLTLNRLHIELNEFILEHFKESINPDNIDDLRRAWADLCMNTTYNPCLDLLNVSCEKQAGFFNRLAEKFGDEFNDFFREALAARFLLTPHAINFSAATNLCHLLPEITLAEVTSELEKDCENIGDCLRDVLQSLHADEAAQAKIFEVLSALNRLSRPLSPETLDEAIHNLTSELSIALQLEPNPEMYSNLLELSHSKLHRMGL